MENCLYRGKIICTFDLKDDNGIYYEDMVLDWKQAAADRLLTCMECGAHVYLAAGPVKEPYFAHYDLIDCDYGSGHETEELKKGKRLLYQLLRRSFPEGDIQARFQMENGLYSTLYCILDGGRSFAIDYRLQNNSLEKFRERDNFYQANKIKPVYILGKKQEKDTKQIDWYQSLIQSSMGYLAFLDTEHERITLKRSFSYRLGSDRRFKYCIKTYQIKELLLDLEGRMLCDFQKECKRIESEINEVKQQYERRKEQLRGLQEDRLKLEEKDKERQEAYRRAKEHEELKIKEEVQVMNRLEKATEIQTTELEKLSLNPLLLEKCRQLIAEGNTHLVSKKYYDAIMGKQNT